jgi:ankyrin repeat protein
MVKLLIENGADLEFKDNKDQISLFELTGKGHRTVVMLLLNMVAWLDIKDKTFGLTLLSLAAGCEYEEDA